MPGCIRSLPFEGKAILSFILSLFALSVPVSFQHAQSSSPVATLFKLLIGVSDFMVAVLPLIIAVLIIYLIFAILSYLAKNYVA